MPTPWPKHAPQTGLNSGSDTNVVSSGGAVTFIKHCEQHHNVLLRVLGPIAHQGPCKRPRNGAF